VLDEPPISFRMRTRGTKRGKAIHPQAEEFRAARLRDEGDGLREAEKDLAEGLFLRLIRRFAQRPCGKKWGDRRDSKT
jgi:hypothetical protein